MTKTSNVPLKKVSAESSGVVSQTDGKSSLQILEDKLQSPTRTKNVLALCDSACSHSWLSWKVDAKLNVQGTATKLTVHGIFSREVVETQMVQLKWKPVLSGDTDFPKFDAKPYIRKHLNVGSEFIDVDGLKQQYLHLESILVKRFTYASVEKILGHVMFHAIPPLEYFKTDQKDIPVAVRLPVG